MNLVANGDCACQSIVWRQLFVMAFCWHTLHILYSHNFLKNGTFLLIEVCFSIKQDLLFLTVISIWTLEQVIYALLDDFGELCFATPSQVLYQIST